MKLGASLRSLVSSLLHRSRIEREMDEELRSHIQARASDLERSGLPPAEALRRARIEFGGFERFKEESREVLRSSFLETLVRDVRYGLRMLLKAPGFAAAAVLTLALGIGANAAIFSLIDRVLLRPLPFKNADRLVDLTEYSPRKLVDTGVSYPDYLAWKQQNRVFEETAAYFLIRASNDIVLGGPFSTERERYSIVTNSFFSILGVQPALGHGFAAGDEIPGGAKVFLASNALWHGVFGGDPAAIGRTYLLDGENFTLAGVMPPGFDFPKGCGIWVPTGALGVRGMSDRISHPFHVLGRLRRGVNLAQAQAQIEAIQRHLGEIYPQTDADWRVEAQPLIDAIVGNVRTSLLVLLGAVGFVLLIACANVANLTLARASAREREYAIRIALGAGRMRLLRQGLTESFVIVGVSIVLAVVLAKAGLALVVSLASIHLPRMDSFRLSIPVLAFLAAVAALTTFLVGLAPALEATAHSPQSALREGGRGASAGRRTRRLRQTLVVTEVALALALLCGAGLMLRSFVRLIRADPGLQPAHLLTVKIALPGAAYPRATQIAPFVGRLLERLQSLPGVSDAAATTMLPFSGESDWGSGFQIVGRPGQTWAHVPAVQDGGGVSLNYFQTLGIPLLRGRDFTSADAQDGNTVIINEAMARKFWPGANPIGQRIVGEDGRSNPREIIGVVADVRSFGLGSPSRPGMYSPYRAAWYTYLVLRTSQDPAGAISAVRSQVAALDRGVAVYQAATMDQLLRRSIAPQRFNMLLLEIFAALALALASVGVYGLLSFAAAQRTHEIGIRSALGADQKEILRLIVWQGMKPVLAGLLAGMLASLALTRLMASLLYGVSATDPATFSGVVILLLVVALAACSIPARRAMRVDPLTALRHE